MAARTLGATWHRSTDNYPTGAAGNIITDGSSPEYGDILKCHLCRHKVWGTWPVMQAHYRDNHGYTPQRNSSPSSSPEPAQPRKKYNKYTPTPNDIRAQQNRRNANQNNSSIGSTRVGYSKHGHLTENPPSPHTHRIKTQAERKIY